MTDMIEFVLHDDRPISLRPGRIVGLLPREHEPHLTDLVVPGFGMPISVQGRYGDIVEQLRRHGLSFAPIEAPGEA